MQQNVGDIESTLRVGIGFGLMFTGFLLQPPASWIAYVGFLAFAITGFTGRCLVYKLLGITTCREEGPH